MYNRRIWHYFVTVFLFVVTLVTVILIGNTILNSFRTSGEILQGIWKLPSGIELSNYYVLLVKEGFGKYFKNSMIIALISIIINIYVSSLASYGIAKFRFKGNGLLRTYFLFGLMFPINAAIAPLYILIRQLGLNDNILGVIVIYISMVSFTIFVFTGFLKNIPDSLIESAKIEGANNLKIFNKIIFPLMTPAIGAIAPLVGVRAWNDFLIPMMLLGKENVMTIPLGLRKYSLGVQFNYSKINMVFTAATVSIVPLLLIYILFSKNIISGITQGAVKE